MRLPHVRHRHAELSAEKGPQGVSVQVASPPPQAPCTVTQPSGRQAGPNRRHEGGACNSQWAHGTSAQWWGRRSFMFLSTGFVALQLLLLYYMVQSHHDNLIRMESKVVTDLNQDAADAGVYVPILTKKQLLMKPPPRSGRNPPSRESGATHAAGKAGEAGALDAGIPTPQKLSPDELRAWASALNQEQHILNSARFSSRDVQIVIMVQVHSRADALQRLLHSLSNVRGIESALLVISCDMYLEEIMQIIEGVKFCQVLPIFFPFSSQLYPESFPGTDPSDCSRDTIQRNGCVGDPDKYGHFREAAFTAIKHHWWWKLNFVFSGKLRGVVPERTRVLLLEEDYLVSPDVLQTLERADALRAQAPQVDLISLGTYFRKDAPLQSEFRSWQSTTAYAAVNTFVSARSNMGMVVDHAFWSKLHACADTFCTWDDYNWDWTIQALQAACPSMGVIHVLQLSSGRVFHAGGCSGVHNSAPACDSGLAIYEQQLEIMKQMEPPASLTLMPGTRQRAAAAPYINGGWGDGRDRQLCKYFAGTGELPRQIVPPNKGGAPLDSKRLGSAPAVSSEEPPAGSGVVQRLVAKASTIIPRLHAASAAARQGAAVPADTPSWTRHEMTSSNKHARKSSIAVEKVQEQPNELGIDPWARSAGAAKESVYRQVNHLLRPDERNEILQLCGRALNHPITTAVALRGLGEDAHVSTGDIPDMWLRDSAFEIAIYMPRMVAKPALRLAVEGTIRRHAFDITMDPYACGFSWKWWDPNVEVDEFNRRQGRGGWVAIRSFEIDSGAYFMNLLWDYYNTDGLYRPDALISETLIHDAVSQMVSTYITEQHHSAQSPYLAFDLPNGGRGKPESYTGMVWSGYRASDDATQYGYNIPDNMYVVSASMPSDLVAQRLSSVWYFRVPADGDIEIESTARYSQVGALERMLVLNAQVWKDSHLHERMSKLKAEILDGLQQHATVVRISS